MNKYRVFYRQPGDSITTNHRRDVSARDSEDAKSLVRFLLADVGIFPIKVVYVEVLHKKQDAFRLR